MGPISRRRALHQTAYCQQDFQSVNPHYLLGLLGLICGTCAIGGRTSLPRLSSVSRVGGVRKFWASVTFFCWVVLHTATMLFLYSLSPKPIHLPLTTTQTYLVLFPGFKVVFNREEQEETSLCYVIHTLILILIL